MKLFARLFRFVVVALLLLMLTPLILVGLVWLLGAVGTMLN